jgi:hypothetical protein
VQRKKTKSGKCSAAKLPGGIPKRENREVTRRNSFVAATLPALWNRRRTRHGGRVPTLDLVNVLQMHAMHIVITGERNRPASTPVPFQCGNISSQKKVNTVTNATNAKTLRQMPIVAIPDFLDFKPKMPRIKPMSGKRKPSISVIKNNKTRMMSEKSKNNEEVHKKDKWWQEKGGNAANQRGDGFSFVAGLRWGFR